MIPIFIFSYNRPEHLENCLNSALEVLHAKDIHIVDNGSDDLLTVNQLNHFSYNKFVTVHHFKSVKKYGKTSGLPEMMDYALKYANSHKYKHVIFVQDDMQFIRSFTHIDSENINRYFEMNTSACELGITFLKSLQETEDSLRSYTLDRSGFAWQRSPHHHSKIKSFSDVGLFHVKRSMEMIGNFGTRERDVDEILHKKGIRLSFYKYPMMMFLPCPQTYRKKSISKIHKLTEYLGGTGFYPFKELDQNNLALLTESRQVPLDSHYLALKNPEKFRGVHWFYTGGYGLCKARGGAIFIVSRILRLFELAINKITTW